MQPLPSDISLDVRHGLSHVFGHLIVGFPAVIFGVGLLVTGEVSPGAPFDVEKVDLAFVETSPKYRDFLLDSLPLYIPALFLAVASCLVHIYVFLPWLLRSPRTKTSQSLRTARALVIDEGSDAFRRILEEPSLRSRIQRSVPALKQYKDESPSPLNTIPGAFVLAWVLVGPMDGSLRFHEVAAEVIPALMIALMLGAKAARDQEPTWSQRLTVALSFLVLAGGEAVALCSLLNDRCQFGDIALAAMAAGFVGLAEMALTWRPSSDP